MTGQAFVNPFSDPLTVECVNGYQDGRNMGSPEPSANRHPAYIHGFRNGRDDIGIKHGETAQQRRDKWNYIAATCGGEQ